MGYPEGAYLMVCSFGLVPWLLLYPRVAASVFDNALLFFGIVVVLLVVGLFFVPAGRDTDWLRATLITPFYQLVLHRVCYAWFLNAQKRPPENAWDVWESGLEPDRIYGFCFLMLAVLPPLLIFT